MKLTDAELRVAKAICKSRTCEGMNCCQWPANYGRVQCPVKAGGYDDAARAAIAELRSPEPSRGRAIGERVGSAKLTEARVREILTDPLGCRRAARKYGVCRDTINDIRNRKTWKHVEP